MAETLAGISLTVTVFAHSHAHHVKHTPTELRVTIKATHTRRIATETARVHNTVSEEDNGVMWMVRESLQQALEDAYIVWSNREEVDIAAEAWLAFGVNVD
jgi:hypothetical protein